MPSEKTKVTIYDVAAHANVAISTVSRVLNNSSDVSQHTRAKVLEAIDTLKFRPDRTAKTLAQQKTQALAVAIPSFTTPFHNELLKGVRTAMANADLDLLLCDLGSKHPRQTLLNFLDRGAVDGLLLVGVPVDDDLQEELHALRAPVVLVGNAREGYDGFIWDDYAGAQAAAMHLLDLGHSRIAMIRAHTESELLNSRIRGFRDALNNAGVGLRDDYLVAGETAKHAGFSEEAGGEAMIKLLGLDEPPTAVFASSDVQALGAWKAAVDSGVKIPSSMAVMGYDDIKMSRYIGLTSVDQRTQEIGQKATELLLDRINKSNKNPSSTHQVVPELHVRRSTVSD